jgi:large subunit ribosomal protein L4
MKANVVTLDNKPSGQIDLDDAVFGLEPRADILHRVVEYQRAKARAGTHKTKDRSEVSGTGKKPFKQKGTGNARQGTLRAPQHEGGGRAHGPVVRSHAVSLNKKVRALGLKMALSSKQKEGALFILDTTNVKDAKTKLVAESFVAMGLTKPLIIDVVDANQGFGKVVRNVKNVNILPTQGANVFDILRHKQLVITKEALPLLVARFAAKAAPVAKAKETKQPASKAKAVKAAKKASAKKPAVKKSAVAKA